MKKIFRVSEKAFLNEKNAQIESEIADVEVISEQIKEKDYRYMVECSMFQDYDYETQKFVEPEEPEEPTEPDLNATLQALTERLNALEAENMRLKTKKKDFEEVQKIIEERNKTLSEISVFESVFATIVEINPESNMFRNSRLSFKSDYLADLNANREINISNPFVLERFLSFLRQEIGIKTQELRAKVENLETSIY